MKGTGHVNFILLRTIMCSPSKNKQKLQQRKKLKLQRRLKLLSVNLSGLSLPKAPMIQPANTMLLYRPRSAPCLNFGDV
jgi:hypothetical protein